MKELQNVVTTYLLDREKHKKYLAVLTALSILVSFVVPFILMRPADSMTKKSGILSTQLARGTATDGVEIVTDEQQKVTLLIGENKPEIRGNTVEETLTLARSKYLLGIASQFGVFLEGDFIDYSADVESRLAVGGGANLSDSKTLQDEGVDFNGNGVNSNNSEPWENGQKGFEVGNGDFTDKISLEKLTNNWGYAHAIVGNGPFKMINTVSHDDYKKMDDSYGKLDKLFVIGSDVNLSDTSVNHTWNKQAYDVSAFRKTDEPLINFATEFTHIRNISKKLSGQVTENTELIFSAGIKHIEYNQYQNNIVDAENLSKDNYWNGNIAHFRYTGEDTDVVKFNITYEEWLAVSEKCSIISYEGIPENANIIINVAKESENISVEVTPQYKFSLVNGIQITPGDLGSLGGKVDRNNGVKNNDAYCEKILYNFSTATSLKITENFSGNILAPNADVTGAKNGHLSGALVAKSFSGALEFGYRPYQGTIDLLGSTSGYTIPMNKFKAGELLAHLAGAQFALYEGDKIAESFITGDSTQMFTVPTKVDYDGSTDYRTAIHDITTTYTLKEQSPPNGYVADNKEYTVIVREVVDTNTLHELENGSTLPTQVTVQLQIKDGETVLFDTGDMIIKDFYSEEAQTRREINANGETFLLTLNNGKITAVAQPTGDVEELIEEEDGTTYIETEVTEVYSFVESSYDSVQTNVKVEIELEDGSTSVIETDDYYDVLSSEVKYSDIPKSETISSETIYKNITQETVTKPISPVAKETFTVTNEDGSETKTFYYDPDSLMMMPYPNSIPQFINEYGLVFQKIGSDTQNPLSDAKIELQKLNADGTYQTIAELTGGTNIIDVKNDLEIGAMYRFYESVANTPNGYETAAPIYFKKTSEYVIEYADDPNAGSWKELKLAEGNNTIQMTDQKIVGAKLTLKKVISGTTTPLDGAKFDLYKDGAAELIVTGIELTNGELNLYEAWKDVSNDYIEKGYLKEGVYYLKEVSPPNGYEAGDDIYFSVKSTDGGYGIELGKPKTVPFTIEYKDNGQQAWANGAAVNVSKIVINVTGPEGIQKVKLYNGKLNNEYGFDGSIYPVVNGKVTIENVPGGVLGNLEIQNADNYDNKITVSSVEVYGDPSNSSSSGSTTDNNIYYVFNYADGTSSAEQSFTGQQLQSFSINTGNVTSVTFRMPKGKVASYFEVYKDWWNDDNRNKKSVSQTANTVTVDLGGASTNIMMLYVNGIAIDENASDEPEETPPAETPETDDAIDAKVEENGDELIVTIGNSKAGQKTNITVQKIWSVPEGYNELPTEIEVTLYKAKDADRTDAAKVETVELNAANGWKKTWSNLESLIDPNSTDENAPRYYYYVEETTVEGYETKITNNNVTSGTITITNKLNTTSHTVIKKWSASPHPTSIQVKLQYFTDNGTNWNDAGKTAILSEANGWTATFENLPSEGRIYRAIEPNVPNGWTKKEKTEGNTTTITNTLKTGKLQITKHWEDNDSTANRPQKVKVNVYRTTIAPSGGGTSGGGAAGNGSIASVSLPTKPSTGEAVYYDYSRLLQYSLYFYDANMCGDDTANNSAYTWRDACHTGDEVDGGFHDAGDHVMFGLPQGYTASTLGWSYYEFSDAYKSLGLKEHYQVIMNEFCQFMKDSTELNDNETDVKSLLYVKGDGDPDHSYWGAPEGQKNDPRTMHRTSNAASDVAAEYAATLALNYLNFGNEEDLKYAKALFNYAKRVQKVVDGDKSDTDYKPHFQFYGSEGWTDDAAWAAAWLYLATDTSDGQDDAYGYKQFCFDNASADYWGYSWNDVSLAALCAKAHITKNWSEVTYQLQKKVNLDSPTTYFFQHYWGSARYNASMQMVALVAAKNVTNADDAAKYSAWAKGQMRYLLGDNPKKTCYVTGFASNSSKYPHHRAESGTDSSNSTAESKYRLIGALVGGPSSKWGDYQDVRNDHNCNEVAIDYNAGLVGAAAGLYHFYKDDEDVAKNFTLVTDPSDIDPKNGIETAYPSAVASSLTANADLPQANSKKATAFKGITVMNGENVAKVNGYQEKVLEDVEFNEEYTVNLKEVAGIKLVVSSSGVINFVANVLCDGTQIHQTSQIGWANNTTVTYEKMFDKTYDVNKIKLTEAWNNNSDITVDLHIYYSGATITINGAESYEIFVGETIDLTATPATAGNTVTWSVTTGNDVVSVDPNTGKVTTLKAGDAVITATETDASGQVVGTDTVSIKVKDVPLGITANPTQIHVDGKTTLSITPEDATITQKSGTEFAVYDPATKTVTGKAVGDAVFEVSKNGNTASLTIKVIEALSITGGEFGEVMDLGTQQTLTANNIGTLTWTSNYEKVLKVVNGVVTAEGVGTATITATDADGATANYTITVQMAAVKPTLPETKEWVKTVELDKAGNWTKLENLPMYDANGKRYYYYIEEVLEGDNLAGSGGAVYMPIDYSDNNGTTIDETETELTVTNMLTEVTQGSMPSAGGEGTKWYYVIGMMLMLTGITTGIVTKRRQNSRR